MYAVWFISLSMLPDKLRVLYLGRLCWTYAPTMQTMLAGGHLVVTQLGLQECSRFDAYAGSKHHLDKEAALIVSLHAV